MSTAAIGARIRRRREALGLTQRAIATRGASYAYISRIEAGARIPSERALRSIARALAVTPFQLETGRTKGTCPHCGEQVGK